MQEAHAIELRRAARVLQLLQGKWTVSILGAMRDRPVRLSELKRAIPSASKKALTSSLRSLEEAKMVVRRDLSTTRLHVEYSLSEGMETSTIALLDQIIAWAVAYEEHLRAFMQPPRHLDDRENDSM